MAGVKYAARATTIAPARSQKTPHPIHIKVRDSFGWEALQLTLSPNGSKCFIGKKKFNS